MRPSFANICSVFLIVFPFSHCARQGDLPVLQGPYLGQKPPGMRAEIFAPGIVSTGDHEGISSFLDGGTVIIFHRLGFHDTEWTYIPNYVMELRKGVWTEPYPASFQDGHDDDNYTVAPDDETLYFDSNRPAHDSDNVSEDHNIWMVRRDSSGWSEPKMLESSVNTADYGEYYPSVTSDGTIYFMSHRDDGFGGVDIYRSRMKDGKYTMAENLGAPINTTNDEMDSFIAADESYLVYCSKTLYGYGEHDLFISFRNQDGSWAEPVNMGDGVNSAGSELRPSITPDGRYMFFSSDRNGNGDVYWVDARVVDDLRRKFAQD